MICIVEHLSELLNFFMSVILIDVGSLNDSSFLSTDILLESRWKTYLSLAQGLSWSVFIQGTDLLKVSLSVDARLAFSRNTNLGNSNP